MTSGGGPGEPVRLDVVIPALDEARSLPDLLADLRRLGDRSVELHVRVVDGGSRDGTVGVARQWGATVIRAPRGRARQIRAGVEAGGAPWILLLHADSRLPEAAADALLGWLRDADPADSAHFRFALDAPGWFWRFLEAGQRLRESLFGLVYGDQGLVLSRATWDAVGGVPELPLMEDVALVDRVRTRGRLRRLQADLPTSPRRYEREGRLRGWLRNATLVSLYRLGVPPRRLAPFYPDRRAEAGGDGAVGDATGADATVIVFARAPRRGEVKSRLAAGTGEEAALRLYRAMGRRVVDAVRDGPWRTVVAGTPPDALGELREWLGDGPDYVGQRGSDLGARMASALGDALSTSNRAVVVGTDAPALDARVVRAALDALDDHDVVLGPAEDGGYYLVGVDTPRPELFRDVPWGTDEVLDTTLVRARAAGLTVSLLTTLRDVDTVDDVPDDLRPLLDAPTSS